MLGDGGGGLLVGGRPGGGREAGRFSGRGEFQGPGRGGVPAEPLLRIFDAEKLVGELPPRALADDAPEYDISELAESYRSEPDEAAGGPVGAADPTDAHPQTAKIGLELLELLASPAVASRPAIYRTYDQLGR